MPHPLLDSGAFVTRLAQPLGELATPRELAALAEPGTDAAMTSSDTVRAEIRRLLRHGGFKPAGRSKPASEYLHAAATEGQFPRINAAVDACNVVSLCSGLPISLVDVDRLVGELAIAIAPAGTSYAFNPSGQTIDASGLVCLFDREGPSGTPVKDAQRTKTHAGTRATLAIVWGTRALPGRTARTVAWYRELVARIPGATLEPVELHGSA
ncbi:MAG TPA: phenylalanine--tRNA ligase beta subunit-related protein [Kofleriaceae bacterium]|nr:phenylalanine--tRNA ligase beta subunit-related protein [Kofleriaceae bacterium]